MTRRRQYRVDTRDLPVVVRLIPNGRPAVPVRVDDLSIQGALVRIPSEESPLAPGDLAELDVLAPGGAAVRVMARVVRQAVDGASPAYGLLFLEPAALEARLTPELARLFNRRRVPRVASAGVRVGIEGGGAPWDVGVRDVGADALALEALAFEAPFADGSAVVLSLELPGLDPMRLDAVLGSRAEGDGTRVIAHLDRDDGQLDARRLIGSWVGDRLRPGH